MKILHITPNNYGYEEVTLIANRVNETNSLSVIEKNGKIFWTGGFLINDTPEIRRVLDSIPKEKQYEFVRAFKMDPFVKFYFEEQKEEVIPVVNKKWVIKNIFNGFRK